MVCQSQPSSSATSDDGPSPRPTWTVAHRPARSVIAAGSGATRRCSPGPRPHRAVRGRTRHRCFRHTSRAGRPKPGNRQVRPLAVPSPAPSPALRATHHHDRHLHMDPHRTVRDHRRRARHVGQTNKQRAHTRRVEFHRGSPDLGRRKTPPDSLSPCYATRTLTPRSDPKRRSIESRPVGRRPSDGSGRLRRLPGWCSRVRGSRRASAGG